MGVVRTLVAFAGYLAVVQSAPAASVVSRPTITASPGVVVGTATTYVSGGISTATAYEYLGIPFAAAPTGTRRFNPPEATSWSEPVQATSLPPACVQQFNYPPSSQAFMKYAFNNPGGPAPVETEDCLFLNIYTPTDASPSKKKSVLFWIFGGNLQFGTGSVGYYNGSSIAGFQDVIVVTFNYRTNVFGFSNSPELARGTQNAGFLDQRSALKWVHENIEAFGGDPEQITIFGQSAGGYSVKQLLAHPPDPLPYRAAIMLSEATLFTSPGNQSYAQVASHFNCSKATSTLACLQKVPATDLQNYIEVNSVSFPPVDDDITRSTDVHSSIYSGKFAKVPIMAGTTSDEARVFLAGFGDDGGANSTEEIVDEVIENLFGNASIITPAILDVYNGLSDDGYVAASALITDLIFTCTTSELTNLLAQHNYDVWRYYYNASFPTEDLFPDAGAWHSSELPQVFGTYPVENPLGRQTPEQVGLSRYMQTAWANFAKDPSAGPGWEKLVGKGLIGSVLGKKQVMQDLGGINMTGGVLIDTSRADGTCPLFEPIINLQGL